LSQLDENNHDHVIYYASQGLHPHEENYATSKLKCLAMYWAIKYFHQYLYRKYFKLIMDHNALIGLFNTLRPSGIIARWITFLSEFDFKPKYHPGCVNNNNDFFSHLGY
jgi:hypothetical protein